MMYNQKMVAAIKANGRILREFKDTVYVPYGSEYSILLKNLHSTRALVNIFIDGKNIVEGGLVLNAGQEVDLERSIVGGNLSVGNKLKFVERTSAIENGPRGIKLEDGLVKIEFQYEKSRPVINVSSPYISTHGGYNHWQNNNSIPQWGPPSGGTYGISGDRFSVTASGSTCQMNVNGILRGVDYSKGEATKAFAASATYATLSSMGISSQSAHAGMPTMDWNEVGITVPGSRSDQKFTTTTMSEMETETHTMVLKLLGETPNNKPVLESVTTKHKPKCTTCGKQNKATAKFCTECGTHLEIFA